MKIKTLNAVKYFFLLLTGLIIIYFLFRNQPNILSEIKEIQYSWVFISGLALMIAHAIRALRWQIIIQPLTSKKTNFFNVFNALMVGYLINLVLPRAGEVARCAWLSKKEKIDTFSLIGTVIAERIFDVMMLGIITLIGGIIYSDVIIKFSRTLDFQHGFLLKLPYLIAAFIIGLVLIALYMKFKKSSFKFFDKIQGLFLRVKDGLLTTKKIKQPYLFTTYTIGIWLFYILSSYYGFKTIKETANLPFTDALLTVIAGSFGMMAPIQGGIGAYHFMVSQCLVHLGVNQTIALFYATIIHLTQTLAIVIVGLLALILDIRFKTNPEHEEQIISNKS